MKTTDPHQTRPEDRLPLRTKIAAGSGEAVINLGINMPKSFAFPIYNLVLGVNPTLLGIALMIPRIWDGFIDPIMGSISDNATNRFGRRRPFMLVGGLLTALAVALLCIFPRGMHEALGHGTLWGYSHGDLFYAGYLMLMSMIFYTFMTVFAVPYGALTMELTPDYNERTRVMTFRTFFTYASGLLLGWLYAIAEWDIFKDPVTGEPDAIRGTYAVGAILFVVLLVFSMLPTLLVKEPFVTEKRKQTKVPVLQGLKESLKVPAFLMIIGAYTIGFLGVIMVIGLGQYVNFFHVYGGDKDLGSVVQGWAHTCAVVTGMITVFTINRLAHKVEKRKLLISVLTVSFFGGLSSWWLYNPDLPTTNWHIGLTGATIRLHPLAISYALIFPGLAGLLVLSSSMIADVCDMDELKSGHRREGMYWAVFNWIQKTAISVALLFSGVILDLTGFDANLPAQTERAIYLMRLNYLLVVCGGVGLAAVIVALIPLDRQKMAAVRAELEERRGTFGGAGDQTPS